MTTRHLATATLAVAVAVCAAAGQSTSDLLQKGIYTQETVGDLDGAIKIYRQILSSTKESRAYAAQAQYRLGICLQAKGDSAGAAQAFQKLAQEYPEQKELVAKVRPFLPYHNPNVGFSVLPPEGWNIQTFPDEKGGPVVVALFEPTGRVPPVAIWAIRIPGTAPDTGEVFGKLEPSQIDAFLRRRPAKKEQQRAREGMANWKIRPESIVRFKIGGREALSALADYIDGGQQKNECMTWVRGDDAYLVIYAAEIKPAELNTMLQRFRSIADTLVVP